ncbi:protein DA1-related 2 [Cajanus cajan]|uniref:LIM and UIM domain-containing At1g19270 n=1 Tax=Cajanus cajan TaxID=3821 RepID=A0A151U9C9_CAJCA|nr:protein DA1-related 2 [Cajanus cajan]KYP75882.1 LIM and UIM domain-containing At1g19270 [Cajanus cajan]
MSPPQDINHLSHPCIYGDFVSSYSERKSGFMKWFGKIFKIGSSRGRGGGHHLEQPVEENMVWPAPARSLDDRARSRKEKEDLDRAIALSLGEDLKRPTGYRWRTGTDEDYAKALQDRMFSSTHPPYTPLPFYPRGYGSMPSHNRICEGCNREILYGNCLGVGHSYFHPECFRCHSCRYPITEREFSLSGKRQYHKSCFKELTHPKCEVCHQYIPINAAGLIEYRCHPYWNQKYCPCHEYDNTARCCSCERLESRDERYYRLEDGRILCFECMESAITDTGECQPLYHSIRDYYEGMNMKIDQQVPMLLVGREALNEAIVGEKNGFHHLPETRGLCLSEEKTVASVYRWPRFGGHRLTGMRCQHQKLTRKCDVTAILVLYGLPRLLTGAILAHELMHAWLRLKGYQNLSPEVEEGICQVLSYMWLDAEVMSGSRSMPSTSASASASSSKKGAKSHVESKLGEFFKNQIANDSSPTYGGGFRAASKAVEKYGLTITLDHIRYTGQFPL